MLQEVGQPVEKVESAWRAVDGDVGPLEQLGGRFRRTDGHPHRMHQPAFVEQPAEGIEGGQVPAVVADEQAAEAPAASSSVAVPLSTSSGGRSSSVCRPGSSRRP